jgi:hypothetical protein
MMTAAIDNLPMIGANPLDKPNNAGLCFLHLAVKMGGLEHVKALLDLGMQHSASFLTLLTNLLEPI